MLDTIEAVRAGSARLTALHGLPPGDRHYGEDYTRSALIGELPLTAIGPTNAHCLLDRGTPPFGRSVAPLSTMSVATPATTPFPGPKSAMTLVASRATEGRPLVLRRLGVSSELLAHGG